MNIKRIIFCLTLLYPAKGIVAQNIPQTLFNYLKAAAKANEMNGNLLIGDNGTVVYKESLGFRNFSGSILNTDSTLFELASISKTITAVAILQLKEKRRLDLHDKFARYFPDFPYPDITIKQLLSHTSGLPDKELLLDSIIIKNPQKIFTPFDIIPALQIFKAGKQLAFQPGERWGYSSIGYSLLALLVEKISKENFATYLKKHIFLPAGMKNTYVQNSSQQKKQSLYAVNYQYNNHFESQLQQMDTLSDWKEWTYNLTGLYGGNNVISTTTDLFLFDQALYKSILLNPATLEEAYTPVKLNNGQNNKASAGSSCGLGWFIFETPEAKIVWHSGANPGVTTLFARNLTTKQCYIILQNVTGPSSVYFGTLDIIKGISRIYRQSAAFVYAKDLYRKGVDYALTHLHILKSDTANYVLTESDMDRAGLEFSRTNNLQQLCLETYKINTLLFPESWNALNNYANAIWKKTGNKEAAILLYQKVLTINSGNEQARSALKQLQE
jgi:CubicO group peptidase (beta-lactamase class C family)